MIILINRRDRVLHYFFRNPTTEIHVRGLSRALGISSPWIIKITDELRKNGLLAVHKDKGLKLVHANTENANFKAMKRAYNLYSVFGSGFVDSIVAEYNHPECIVLFGSYARGEDTEESDIDVAVITPRNSGKDWHKAAQKLGRNVAVKELRSGGIAKEFLNTLANGIVLYGYLTVMR